MVEVCQAFRSRINAQEYDDMLHAFPAAWPALRSRAGKQWVRVDEPVDADADTACQRKRLDVDAILKHYRSKGPCNTFMASTCSLSLADGSTAPVVYAMPKFQLNFAEERRDDLFAALRLIIVWPKPFQRSKRPAQTRRQARPASTKVKKHARTHV